MATSAKLQSLGSAIARIRADRLDDLEELDLLVVDLREIADDVERLVGKARDSLGMERRVTKHLHANGGSDAR